MRRIIAVVTIIINLIISTNLMADIVEHDQNAKHPIDQLRVQLMSERNSMKTLTDDQYIESLEETAEALKKIGKDKLAEQVLTMSDPAIRPYLDQLYKEKIDSISENGVTLLFGLFILLIAPRNNHEMIFLGLLLICLDDTAQTSEI